jgi:quercetin dioxygenase-like cupin family protein
MKRVLCVLSVLAFVLGASAMAGETSKTTKPAGTVEKSAAAMSEAAKTEAKTMTTAVTTGQVMKMADLKWQDAAGYIAGVKVAQVMKGPQEIGVAYLKIPAGTKVAAHSHPATHWGTVVSGTGTLGLGTDATKGVEYGPGSSVYFPTKAVHWLTAKTETVIYANMLGPEGIDYVNANEDPRKAQASR